MNETTMCMPNQRKLKITPGRLTDVSSAVESLNRSLRASFANIEHHYENRSNSSFRMNDDSTYTVLYSVHGLHNENSRLLAIRQIIEQSGFTIVPELDCHSEPVSHFAQGPIGLGQRQSVSA